MRFEFIRWLFGTKGGKRVVISPQPGAPSCAEVGGGPIGPTAPTSRNLKHGSESATCAEAHVAPFTTSGWTTVPRTGSTEQRSRASINGDGRGAGPSRARSAQAASSPAGIAR